VARVLGSLFAACVATLVGACGSPLEREVTPSRPPRTVGAPRADLGGGNVVLVTLDGVRWQDALVGIDATLAPGRAAGGGLAAVMPRTHARVATSGFALGLGGGCATMRTEGGANVSLPGYTELLTGRPTACRDNECPRVALPTILDEVARRGGSAASIASWEALDRAASATDEVVVSAGSTPWRGPRPASPELDAALAGAQGVAPYPGVALYRPDVHTAKIALAYLFAVRPAALHVALGDTDEWGHRGDYAAYLDALRLADDFLGTMADRLEAAGDLARTTVIVTTDHGRGDGFRDHGAAHPGSERTFVLGFGGGMPARGIVCGQGEVLTTDVAPTMRALLGLPPDGTPHAGVPIGEIVDAVAP